VTITSLRPVADETFTWDLPEPFARPNPDWVLSDPLPDAPIWFTTRQTIVGAAILLIALVHVTNIGSWPLFFDDEGTYVAEAWAVYMRGDLAHYTYWYDHPPGGWLQLAAFFAPLNLLGVDSSVLVGRYVMVIYTMVTSGLIFKLCRNLGLRFPTAVASMLIWGLCPLVVFEARQVMLDNMATAWLLGAFVCATSRRQYLSRHLLAGVCFAVAILSKETTVILAPALLYALWTHCYKATRWFSVMASVLMTMLLVSIYPLFALLKSELVSGPGHVSLQDALAFQLVSRTGSGSIFDPTSVAYDTVRSWLFYDRILLIGGLAAGVVCLALRNVRVIGLSLLILGVVALRPGGYLPLMYVIAVLPFAAVAVAGVGQWLFDQLARVRVGRAQAGRVVASVLAVAAVVSVGAQWATKNADALTDRPNDSYYQALHYVKDNLDRSSGILVDDSYWNPLVDAGWSSDGWHGAIWYFKLDLDPVARESDLQNGWKDIDYILVNDVMVQNFDGLSKLPQLSDAYRHSHVLKQWGSGQNQVQLRRINERMVPFGSVGEAAKAKLGVPPVIAPEPGQEATVKIRSSFSNGQWTVGKDINPGTYRTKSTSRRCYWAKISDLAKETKGNSQYGRTGRLTVKITKKDEAFLTTRCGTWTKASR
jgi:4-amino-4-deoxy-L-arabinose transferase-like glycosyltransferase